MRRLPVIDGDRMVGILTLDDLTAKAGDLGFAQDMTSEIMRAQMPDFYFFERGG